MVSRSTGAGESHDNFGKKRYKRRREMKLRGNKGFPMAVSWICLVFLFSIFCAFGGTAEAKDVTTLKLANGSLGSYWYTVTTTVTELLKKKVPTLEIAVSPGRGASNIPAVHQRKSDLAISLSVTAYDGFMGRAPFKEKNEKIRQVVCLADNPYYMVVWANSGIKTVTDLKGKRLNVTPRGYTSEVLTQVILEAYGMSYKDLKKTEYASNRDAIVMMKDGHIDGMTFLAGRYSSYIFDLSSARPIRLLPLDKDKIAKMTRDNPGLSQVMIPASMYNMEGDVLALEAWLHLIANSAVSDDVIYDMTKILLENINVLKEFSKGTQDLTPEQMATDLGIPFHEGALKYFKEKGLR